MLYKNLFRRALALQLTTSNIRTFSAYASTMAKAPQSFTLDRSIFNQALYSRMRDFWFADLSEGATAPNMETVKKWYGGIPHEEKKAFDGECRENFGHVLDALGPEKLVLPAFESYEKEIEDSEAIASPLLAEVKVAQSQDTQKGSETLLSLILILDQMSRNVFRDASGLKLVYTHYDRLGFALLYSCLRLSPNPTEHESLRHRPVIRSWFMMPLMHSEHLPSHELWLEMVRACQQEVKAAGDQHAVDYLDKALGAEEDHIKILRKVGRYPHRNAALGRENTKEEEEELKSGETFGVQQDQGKYQEKSEL